MIMHVAMALRSLDDESWGERLLRARRRTGISLQEAAHRITECVVPVSYSTLMRLETLPDPPTDAKRRMFAVLALVAYGYQPEEFGVSTEDLPRWITEDRLSDLPISQKRWIEKDAA